MGHFFRSSGLALAACVLASAAAGGGQAVMAKLPLRFEENRGQFGKSVRYTARSVASNIHLTDRGPSFQMGERRVQIQMIHANPAPTIEPLNRMAAQTNYMIGSQSRWHTGVSNYQRVRYHAIYPGVDIVYYGNQGQLEYDFELQPGVSPDAIRMEFAGAELLAITPAGDLAIHAGGTQAVQKKPVIFQDGRRIAGHYTLLAHNEAGLSIDGYDPARPLVIDPILVYANYFGTSGFDQVTAMKLGSNGLLYVAGSTNSAGLGTIDGAYSDHLIGLTDIFLAIIDTREGNNVLKYWSYLGGANNDIPSAIEADSAGFVYLTGTTTSTDFPIVGAPIQGTGAATTVDAFVAKIDPNTAGTPALVYSTFLGGATGSESANGIALDKNGLIYIVGTTRSTDFPVTASAYAGVLYGAQDAFITVIDTNRTSPVYSTYMGGELNDDGRAIAVGSNGLVYFAASTNSTQFPLESTFYRGQLQGSVDIAIGVIDITKSGNGPGGSMLYSTYFGGGDVEEVRGMALDANNNVILTGYTLSEDFPVTPDAVRRTPAGNGDVFVSILNPNDLPNFLAYSTYFGGTQGEVAYAVKPDGKGNIYLTGYTLSSDLFTIGAPQPGYGGGVNAFVAAIRPGVAGTAGIRFCTYLGQSGTYVGNAVELGSDGSVYVGGYGQKGLPAGNDYNGGTSDGFVVRMQ